MKKLCLLLFLSSFCLNVWGQDCPPNDITLYTQEEVDNFAINYPNCTELNNNLQISGSIFNIVNLNGLAQITRIGGNFELTNTWGLTNLNGLENLNTIDGSLLVYQLEVDDFSGLENLSSIGGSITIDDSSFDNFNGLQGLTEINGTIDITLCNFTDFFGLSNVHTITEDLQVNQCQFENFNGLDQLTTIVAGLSLFDNQFTNFSGLESLTDIGFDFVLNDCSFDDFCGLEGLTTINQSIEIHNCNFNNFNGLNNLTTINQNFFILLCEIGSFHGLESLTTIQGWFEIMMGIKFQDFSGLDNLTTIGESFVIFDGVDIVNFNGLENLSSINGTLEIFHSQSLISLSGLENLEQVTGGAIIINDNQSLISISELESIDLNSLNDLSLLNNHSLSFCANTPICNYLSENLGNVSIKGNAPGCQDEFDVLVQCSDELSKIRYFIYYDSNQNQIFDQDEILYSDASIEVDPLAFYDYTNSDNGGTLFLELGEYTLNLEINSLWDITTDSSAFQLSVVDSNTCDSIYFGVAPNQDKTLLITTIQSPPTRCNEFVTFDVRAKNLGTTTKSGILWFEKDEHILAVELINPPDTIVDSLLCGWYFTDLLPSQSIVKHIDLQIPGPPEFEVGDFLHFKSYLEYSDVAGPQSATTFLYDPEVRCSYDPNDKLIHPNRDGNYTLFEEQLIYTIRFQNTGNDYAYDVTIRDTLDPNLNIETFRVLGTSHPNQLATTLQNDQFLTFSFENIFLPDSTTDFDGSQGYVSYLIEGNENLPEETNVTNTAGIYFDFNPPVITNTTENLMVSELPTTSISSAPDALRFVVQPNPTSGQLLVSNEKISEAKVQLIDYTGRLILEKAFHFQEILDLSQYPSGVYWLRLTNKEGDFSQKVVKF